jgi:hypothetical protein
MWDESAEGCVAKPPPGVAAGGERGGRGEPVFGRPPAGVRWGRKGLRLSTVDIFGLCFGSNGLLVGVRGLLRGWFMNGEGV